jgi:hypothetical protein
MHCGTFSLGTTRKQPIARGGWPPPTKKVRHGKQWACHRLLIAEAAASWPFNNRNLQQASAPIRRSGSRNRRN